MIELITKETRSLSGSLKSSFLILHSDRIHNFCFRHISHSLQHCLVLAFLEQQKVLLDNICAWTHLSHMPKFHLKIISAAKFYLFTLFIVVIIIYASIFGMANKSK